MILSSLQSPQNQRKCALTTVGTLLVFGLVFYTQKFYLAAATENALPHRVYNEAMQPDNVPKDLPGLIAQLWKPTLHPMNDTHFVTDEGYRYDLADGVHRWPALGKKLLILDVDTRMEEKDGDLMNAKPMNHQNMTGRTGGWMNHQLYAMIHGYDYRLVRAPNYEGRHGTWVKVPMIKEALKTHDFVVFLDADAVFMYPHMPFEWLMSMWNVTTETLVAMAEDPNSSHNRDHNGWVMWNTGFIIAQQSNRTQELFDVWDKCPTGERYKECGHWDKDWAHEQAAFSNHIRYDYNTTDDLRVISCMDGNGAPYIGDKKCGGVFIRHHWFHKHLTVRNLKEAVLDLFMRRMHSNFHAEKDEYYLDAHKESYPLQDLQI